MYKAYIKQILANEEFGKVDKQSIFQVHQQAYGIQNQKQVDVTNTASSSCLRGKRFQRNLIRKAGERHFVSVFQCVKGLESRT